MTEAPTYKWPAKLLHWLTAAAVLCAVALGLTMGDAEPGPTQNRMYDLHRSFGALVLSLTGLRLLWRLFAPLPPPVPGLPMWQEKAAVYVHRLLYALLFAVPVMGWAATSAYGARIAVFGLFELKPILPRDRALSEALFEVHEVLAITLIFVFAVHIGAALHHHFIRKDETLRRMLP